MEIENYLIPFLSNVGSYEIKDGRLFLYDKADKAKYIVFFEGKADLTLPITPQNQANMFS
jgi:hypothetical protein